MFFLCRAPDRGHFCVFDAKKMGKNAYSLTPDASRKRPVKPGLTHHEKMDASFYACFGAKRFFFFSKFLKDIPNERNALNCTDNSPCQKLATKIKAFQSAFEAKDSAANGTCRQVILPA